MFTDDDDDDDDFADHFSVDADVAALYYVYTRFVFVCFCSTKQKHKSAGKQKKSPHSISSTEPSAPTNQKSCSATVEGGEKKNLLTPRTKREKCCMYVLCIFLPPCAHEHTYCRF